jgi:RNA polymerase sigma factor (sigma-70 family)
MDCEDVVQEALFQAYRKLNRFDDTRPLKPWLFQIAHNRCIDFLRRRQVRQQAEAAPWIPTWPTLQSRSVLASTGRSSTRNGSSPKSVRAFSSKASSTTHSKKNADPLPSIETSHAPNRAYLSSTPIIWSRGRSGIARTARWIPTSRYSARTASSAGAANTLIDNVEKSRPAADAA